MHLKRYLAARAMPSQYLGVHPITPIVGFTWYWYPYLVNRLIYFDEVTLTSVIVQTNSAFKLFNRGSNSVGLCI